MNSDIIREKNIANNKIKSLQTFIEKNKSTINRLSSQSKLSEFDKKQIKERESKNIEHAKEIEILEERIKNLSNGNLNEEIKNNNDDSLEKIKKYKENDAKKYQDKIKKKELEKEFSDKGFALNRRNYDDLNPRQMDYEYKRFCKMCDKIPPYILRNLKEMPSNKGYIISDRYGNGDLWCFGELEEEKNKPLIMFKKLKDDVLEIYEIDDEYRTIYQKINKGPKKLISKEKRTKIF